MLFGKETTMSDLHLKLLREAGRWGDGSGTREPCVNCGGNGKALPHRVYYCTFCDGTGWEFIGRPHLRAVREGSNDERA